LIVAPAAPDFAQAELAVKRERRRVLLTDLQNNPGGATGLKLLERGMPQGSGDAPPGGFPVPRRA
jgi:hypothetical protein